MFLHLIYVIEYVADHADYTTASGAEPLMTAAHQIVWDLDRKAGFSPKSNRLGCRGAAKTIAPQARFAGEHMVVPSRGLQLTSIS